jgi:hypothetical protein
MGFSQLTRPVGKDHKRRKVLKTEISMRVEPEAGLILIILRLLRHLRY